MTTTGTEVLAVEEKRDSKGRKILPLARRLELVAAYRTSGLTQLEFARREGVSYTSFSKWCSQLARAVPSPAPRFAETRIGPGVLSANWSFEVALPNGCVVRAARAAELAELLSLIGR